MSDTKVMVARTLDMRKAGYSMWWIVEYRDPMNVHMVNVWQSRSAADDNCSAVTVKNDSTVYIWGVLAAANEAGLNVKRFAMENSALLSEEKSRRNTMSPLFAAPYGGDVK